MEPGGRRPGPYTYLASSRRAKDRLCTSSGPSAPELHRRLGQADHPQAGVTPPGPKPARRHSDPAPLGPDRVPPRSPHTLETDPRVPAVITIRVPEHVHAALDVHAGGVAWD